MLVGDPPYTGSTAQAILGKIIAGELASAAKHRKSVPANVDAAIRKALEKLSADRFSGAQDFAKALGDASFRHGEITGAGIATGAGPWNRLTVGFAALAAGLSLALGWALLSPEPSAPVARFASPFEEGQFPVPGSYLVGGFTADGSALVYAGPGASGGGSQLWIRRWSDLDATPIRGTEGAVYPVLSPDEREVAFRVGDALRGAPLDGGPSRTLVEDGRGGAVWDWGSDGFVYFSLAAGLARVPATGGGSEAVESLTEPREGELAHGLLTLLSGERRGVFQVVKDLTGEGGEVWAIDLETHERTFLTSGSSPRYASTGHLLFATSDRVLMRQPIEASTAELAGPAVPVIEDLAGVAGLVSYAVSESGSLIVAVGGRGGGGAGGGFLIEPVWVTRSGEAVPVDPGWRFTILFLNGSALRLSPDGSRVAVQQVVDGNDDIWIKQLPDGPLERLTSDDGVDALPFWSPDSEFVAYSRDDGSGNLDIWQLRADGTGAPQLILDHERSLTQGRWSPDGEWMVFRTGGLAASPDDDILGFRPGVDSAVVALVASPEFSEQDPALSPNGRWLAYSSDRTGRREVYVRPFPNVDSTRVTVSLAGGHHPVWAHSGSELFFDANEEIVSAEVEADSVFRVLSRETLFERGSGLVVPDGTDSFDVGPDDERFLMMRFAAGGSGLSGAVRYILIQNWFEELRERFPN